MDSQMLHQMGLLPEAFVAIWAVERPFIRVGPFVLGQSGFLLEAAAANLTTKIVFSEKQTTNLNKVLPAAVYGQREKSDNRKKRQAK